MVVELECFVNASNRAPREARRHHSRSHLRSLSKGAAAHLEVRFPFSVPISVEPRRYHRAGYRKTPPALPSGRQTFAKFQQKVLNVLDDRRLEITL
jgi:hypothetical protein